MSRLLIQLSFNILLLIFGISISSCTNSASNVDIVVVNADVANSKVTDIDISQCKSLSLERVDTLPIFFIEHIFFAGNTICVQDINKSLIYDINGKFITKLGESSRGIADYEPFKLFEKNDNYYIYNSSKKSLTEFNNLGEIIGCRDLSTYPKFNGMVQFGKNDNYVVLQDLYKNRNLTPKVELLDSQFNTVSKSTETNGDGFYRTVALTKFDDEVIFTPFEMCDTIYSISEERGVVAKYLIDFKEATIPSSIDGSSTFYDRTQYTIRPENVNKFAKISSSAIEDKDNLYLGYQYQEKQFLLIYSKSTNKCEFVRLFDSNNNKALEFSCYSVKDGKLYFAVGNVLYSRPLKRSLTLD